VYLYTCSGCDKKKKKNFNFLRTCACVHRTCSTHIIYYMYKHSILRSTTGQAVVCKIKISEHFGEQNKIGQPTQHITVRFHFAIEEVANCATHRPLKSFTFSSCYNSRSIKSLPSSLSINRHFHPFYRSIALLPSIFIDQSNHFHPLPCMCPSSSSSSTSHHAQQHASQKDTATE
jgi:hypothetical protein